MHSRARSSGRRRHDGRAIQHALLGASRRSRSVRRSVVLRSAHRRDHPHRRAHGCVALAHRLQHLRGPPSRRRQLQGSTITADAFAMWRRRQHAAHEIGHTLGFPHNYIAGSQGRTSVMAYPFPLISLNDNGQIDLSKAYAPAGGAWDTLTVRYGYTWYPERGRGEGGARPHHQGRHLDATSASSPTSMPAPRARFRRRRAGWKARRCSTPCSARRRVRRLLIDKFDERAIKPGEPMYLLNMRFAHVYLHHRYSLEGLIKNIGGMDFRYAMRGDSQTPTTIVPAAQQRRALGMALDALEPAALAVPERVLAMIPPGSARRRREHGMARLRRDGTRPDLARRWTRDGNDREHLRARPLGRLVLFNARDAANPSVDDVMNTVVERTWGAAPSAERRQSGAAPRGAAGGAEHAARSRRRHRRAGRSSREHGAGVSPTSRSSSPRCPVAPWPIRHSREKAIRDINRYFEGQDDPRTRSRYAVIPLPWP